MRQILQIALTRTEAERRQYLQQFHAGHHDRQPGAHDSFMRWAYSDPRIEEVPLLLAELDRGEAEYAGAMEHEADVLVRERAHGKTPAQREQRPGARGHRQPAAARHARHCRGGHHPPDATTLARAVRRRPLLRGGLSRCACGPRAGR